MERTPVIAVENGAEVVYLEERHEAGVLWNPQRSFTDGDIDVDLRGRDVMQRSFIGIAFRMIDAQTYDAVWLRPFNFRSNDPARRARAIQYASYPDYPWQRLRAEHPGTFESDVPPSVAPDAWIHLHLEIRGRGIRAFLDGADRPALEIETPEAPRSGAVGLWVGSDSDGRFKNLSVVERR